MKMSLTERNCTDNLPPNDGYIYCPATVDVFRTCWNYTRADTEVVTPCPEIFKSEASAIRKCESNGEWYIDPERNTSWINFNSCVTRVPSVNLIYVYFFGYSLSIVCLVISLVIFFLFKQLNCDRVILHKNLLSCYLINAVVWLMFYSVVPNVDVMSENSVYCQVLFVVATYFSVGTYIWMFSEGLYLTVILVLTFQSGSNILFVCLSIGWGFPFILTMAYALARYLLEKPNECWMTKSNLALILTIPNLVALTANLMILLFILQILTSKMRHSTTREEKLWRKTAKAVFILIPLFGIQNIIFCINVENSIVSVIQDYITGITTSFQGVLVSSILCFFNGEVKKILRRRTSRHTTLQPPKTSRRGTYTTEVTLSSQSRKSISSRVVAIIPSNIY